MYMHRAYRGVRFAIFGTYFDRKKLVQTLVDSSNYELQIIPRERPIVREKITTPYANIKDANRHVHSSFIFSIFLCIRIEINHCL